MRQGFHLAPFRKPCLAQRAKLGRFASLQTRPSGNHGPRLLGTRERCASPNDLIESCLHRRTADLRAQRSQACRVTIRRQSKVVRRWALELLSSHGRSVFATTRRSRRRGRPPRGSRRRSNPTACCSTRRFATQLLQPRQRRRRDLLLTLSWSRRSSSSVVWAPLRPRLSFETP
jgi:hypothetical protein